MPGFDVSLSSIMADGNQKDQFNFLHDVVQKADLFSGELVFIQKDLNIQWNIQVDLDLIHSCGCKEDSEKIIDGSS